MQYERNKDGQNPELKLESRVKLALENAGFQAQMLEIVLNNYAFVDAERTKIETSLSENTRAVDRINEIVLTTISELQDQPEEVRKEKVDILVSDFRETYDSAEAAIPGLTDRLKNVTEIAAKHEGLAEVILDHDLASVQPVQQIPEELDPSITVTQGEDVLLHSNTVEAQVFWMVLVSLDRAKKEERSMSSETDTHNETLNLLEKEKEDNTAKLRNPGWVLRNSAEAIKLLGRQREIDKQRQETKAVIETISVRLTELVQIIPNYQALREGIVEFYQTNGGIDLVVVPQTEQSSVVETVQEVPEVTELTGPGEAILNILLATSGVTNEPEVSPHLTATQEIKQAEATEALRFSWHEFFGEELRAGMTSDQYSGYAQNFRNTIIALINSPKFAGDVAMQDYASAVRVEYVTSNRARIDYQLAIGFIDTIVKVEHLKAVFTEPEPVARVIALVYKRVSGVFKNHHEFMTLAREIMESDLYREDLQIREIIDIMLLDEASEGDLREESSNNVATLEEAESKALAANIQRATSDVRVTVEERKMTERNLARGIVEAAIEFFNQRADGKNMKAFHFPLKEPEYKFSRDFAMSLVGNRSDRLRHSGTDRGILPNTRLSGLAEGYSIYDLIVLYVGKKHNNLYENTPRMKRLRPLIEEVYNELYIDQAKK